MVNHRELHVGSLKPFERVVPLSLAEYDAFATGGGTASNVYAYIRSAGNAEVGVWESGAQMRASATLTGLDNLTDVGLGGGYTTVIGGAGFGGVFTGTALQTVTAIPEPSAFGLLALSAAGLVLRRKRRA